VSKSWLAGKTIWAIRKEPTGHVLIFAPFSGFCVVVQRYVSGVCSRLAVSGTVGIWGKRVIAGAWDQGLGAISPHSNVENDKLERHACTLVLSQGIMMIFSVVEC
jgi:hypothetical protein